MSDTLDRELGIVWDEPDVKSKAIDQELGIVWDEPETTRPRMPDVLAPADKIADTMNEPDKEKKNISNALLIADSFDIAPSVAYKHHDQFVEQIKKVEDAQYPNGPFGIFGDSIVNSMLSKSRGVFKGITPYTPGQGFLDPMMNKAADALYRVRNPGKRENVNEAAGGPMWPKKEGGKWYEIDPKQVVPTLNTWAANVGDYIPLMAMTFIGKKVGAASGRLIGGAVAMATGGPDPSDMVVIPAVMKACEHLGGAAPLILNETAGFLDYNQALGIDLDIAEKYSRYYGLSSGAVEYAQYLGRVTPFTRIKVFKGIQNKFVSWMLNETLGSIWEGCEEFSQQGLENFFTRKAIEEMRERRSGFNVQSPDILDGGLRAFTLGAGISAIVRGGGSALRATYSKVTEQDKQTMRVAGFPVDELDKSPAMKVQEMAAEERTKRGEPLTPLQKAEQAETEQAAEIGERGKKQVWEMTKGEFESGLIDQKRLKAAYTTAAGHKMAIQVGTVNDFLVDSALRDEFKDVLNIPVKTNPNLETGAAQFKAFSGDAKLRAAQKQAGTPTGIIEIGPQIFSGKAGSAEATFIHEVAHAARNAKAREMGVTAEPSAYEASKYFIEERHRKSIEQALSEGKPVSAEVLADYPDLAEKVKPIEPIRIGGGELGGIVLTASARSPGKIQATDFTAEGKPSGHEEYASVAEALAENADIIDHPVFNLRRQSGRGIRVWEEATLESPIKDQLTKKKYVYVSPLRPLVGVNVEGLKATNKDGTVGVLYRDDPLPLSKQETLNLFPIMRPAIFAATSDLAKQYLSEQIETGRAEVTPKATPKIEKAPTEEQPLDYVKEREALAEKVGRVKEKATVQLGKAAIGQYIEQPATTKEEAVHVAAKQIRDTRLKEYEAYKKDDFLNRLEAVGKIHTKYFKGAEEIQDIPVWVRMKVFTSQTSAMDIDEVANKLGMTDDALIQKLKTYKGMEKPSTKIADYYEEVERDYTIYEKVRVNEADLDVGMTFTIEGDNYRVVSKHENKTVVKNHETLEIESFEDIDVDKESIHDTEGNVVPLGKAITIAEKRIEEAAERGVTAGKAIGKKQEKARKKEVEARAGERKATKAYIKKLIRRIAKPASAETDLYYAQNIELIQEALDPANRSKRTLRLRQKTREYLERNPTAKEYMPKKVLDLLDKKAANEMTIEELEEMDSDIALMRKLGRNKYKSKQDIKQNEWTARRNGLLGNIMGGKPFKPSKEIYIGKPKVEPIRTGYYSTLIPQSLFDLIDGGKGTYSGPFHNTYYNEVNNLEDQKWRHMDKRTETVRAQLTALQMKIGDLMRKREVGGRKYTIADMIGIYGLSQNKLSLAALIYGNFGNLNPFTARDHMKDVCDHLTADEKKVAKVFMDDFEANYQRLRQAFIAYTNRDLGHEINYLPMFRTEVAEAMLKEQMAEELLHRENIKKAFAPRGMTIERLKDIPGEHQKPIKTNIVEIWADAVQREEHFIAFAEKIKDLQKFNRDETIRRAIEQRFGRSMMKRVENYTNAIANPNIYKQYATGIEKGLKVLRQHAALAYLSFNTVTALKQIPSILYYGSRSGYGYLIGSMMYCATNPKKAIEFVNQDKQMEHTSIERELEEWKRRDKPGYERAIAQVGKAGFFLIRTFDKIVKTIGYIATYTKHLDMGYSDQRARQEALNTTLRTQPAAHAKDIAEIYRWHELANVALQFSNQLNKIWNMAVYDIPAQFHNHKYGRAIVELTSMAMASVMIWAVTHRRWPEEPEDIAEALSEGALSYIPAIGRMIVSARNGWRMSLPAALQPIESILTLASKSASSKQKVNAIIEGVAVGLGLPYIAGKRVYRTIANKDLRELIGGPPRK